MAVSHFVGFRDFFALHSGENMVIMGTAHKREVGLTMRELYLQTLALPDETGMIRHYDYTILIDEMDVGPFSCESYGIRVSEQGGAQASVPHVTCSAARIDELCELVVRNGVTPTTLHDVLADWL